MECELWGGRQKEKNARIPGIEQIQLASSMLKPPPITFAITPTKHSFVRSWWPKCDCFGEIVGEIVNHSKRWTNAAHASGDKLVSANCHTTSYVAFGKSHVTRHTSHVKHQTSHVTRLHVTHYTSHVTRHTLHGIGIQHP